MLFDKFHLIRWTLSHPLLSYCWGFITGVGFIHTQVIHIYFTGLMTLTCRAGLQVRLQVRLRWMMAVWREGMEMTNQEVLMLQITLRTRRMNRCSESETPAQVSLWISDWHQFTCLRWIVPSVVQFRWNSQEVPFCLFQCKRLDTTAQPSSWSSAPSGESSHPWLDQSMCLSVSLTCQPLPPNRKDPYPLITAATRTWVPSSINLYQEAPHSPPPRAPPDLHPPNCPPRDSATGVSSVWTTKPAGLFRTSWTLQNLQDVVQLCLHLDLNSRK